MVVVDSKSTVEAVLASLLTNADRRIEDRVGDVAHYEEELAGAKRKLADARLHRAELSRLEVTK